LNPFLLHRHQRRLSLAFDRHHCAFRLSGQLLVAEETTRILFHQHAICLNDTTRATASSQRSSLPLYRLSESSHSLFLSFFLLIVAFSSCSDQQRQTDGKKGLGCGVVDGDQMSATVFPFWRIEGTKFNPLVADLGSFFSCQT